MFRRFLSAAICLFGLGMAIAVQAQDDPPTPSVADAVSTLLAQTQQAPTQVFVTQTVQAALEQALTATAQTSTPAPAAPINAETLEVISTTEIDQMAGPGNSAARLAPDGERFVHSSPSALCLYEGTVEARCIDPDAYELRIDPETIRWSPDSRYVTFTEDFFRFLHDPDIWVWDTTTDALNNLTDDGAGTFSFTAANEGDIDLLPTWLPDGTLTFLRYPHEQEADEVIPPDIYTIAPDGSGLTQVGTLDVSERWAIYSMSSVGEQLMYVYLAPDPDNLSNGVWVSEADGSSAEHLVAPGEQARILTADAIPGGDYILFNDPSGTFSRGLEPADSIMRLANVVTGKLSLIDPNHLVNAAGWSPDGSVLAYTVLDRENEENSGLYITDTPGTAGRMILAGMFTSPSPRQELPLVWGANDTILLGQQGEAYNILVVELGS